ncbi:heme peroxidase [Cladochytrium replicatum]|nr:heme peroxidase [Cladochytrium replicatum]
MVAANEEYIAAREEILAILKEKNCHPIFVRLAWHEAGTYDVNTKTGGARGLMRFNVGTSTYGANVGLGIARGLLEPVKEKHPSITYADLWTLAGVVAIEYGLQRAGNTTAKPVWRAGRIDADESATTPDGRLPDATKGADHLRNIFYRMGLSDKDIVALSGAHTLGRMHPDRSGFEGPWVLDPLAFDNTFFVDLLKSDYWTLGQASTGNAQYWSPDKTAMVNTDMVLAKDPAFRVYVEKYAASNDAFVADFFESYQKLLELSYAEGELVQIPGLY